MYRSIHASESDELIKSSAQRCRAIGSRPCTSAAVRSEAESTYTDGLGKGMRDKLRLHLLPHH